ncbi:PTS sugar transporter subunit IIA [bacterium]|nr:PTS sugar transporter subunit IIA [bacterium]
MKITEFLQDELILIDLAADSKEEAIRQMIDRMARMEVVGDAGAFFREVMDREALGSTAVPGGVAFPHARSSQCRRLAVAFARMKKGVAFGGSEGKNTQLVFLISCPLHEATQHVQLLGLLARTLNQKETRESLLDARNPETVLQILS